MARFPRIVAALAGIVIIIVFSSAYIFVNFMNLSAQVVARPAQFGTLLEQGATDGLLAGSEALKSLLSHARTRSDTFEHESVVLLLAALNAQPGRRLSGKLPGSSNFFPTCFELLEFYRHEPQSEQAVELQLLVQATCLNRAVSGGKIPDEQLLQSAQAAMPGASQVQGLATQIQAAHAGKAPLSHSMQLVAAGGALSSLRGLCGAGPRGVSAAVICDASNDALQMLAVLQGHTKALLAEALLYKWENPAPVARAARSAGGLKGGPASRSEAGHVAPGWHTMHSPLRTPTEHNGWHALDSPWMPVTALWVLLGTPAGQLPAEASRALVASLHQFSSPFGVAVLCSGSTGTHTGDYPTELHAVVASECSQVSKRLNLRGEAAAVVLPFLNALLHWASAKHGLGDITATAAKTGAVLSELQQTASGTGARSAVPGDGSVRGIAVDALVGVQRVQSQPQAWRTSNQDTDTQLLEEGGVHAAAVLSDWTTPLAVTSLQYFACNSRALPRESAQHCATPTMRSISWEGDSSRSFQRAAEAVSQSKTEGAAAPPPVAVAAMCAPAPQTRSHQILPMGVSDNHRLAPSLAACCSASAAAGAGFSCPGSATQQLPCARVNDGLCDCPGSCADEPSTSAAGGDRTFWCASGVVQGTRSRAVSQQAGAPQLSGLRREPGGRTLVWPPAATQQGGNIPSSRVGDGVCDCVGGEDEMQWGGGAAAACPAGEMCAVCSAVHALTPQVHE